jgi:hypothetical protein
MCWLCVLNPTAARFETVKPLLEEAHGLAVAKFQQQITGAVA